MHIVRHYSVVIVATAWFAYPHQEPPMSKTARNERLKLTANFMNNIGIGTLFACIVGPIFAGQYNIRDVLVVLGCGILSAVILHLIARLPLRGLED